MSQKIKLYYNVGLDIMCFVQPDGKIYKYIGEFNKNREFITEVILYAKLDEWYKSKYHPETHNANFEFIGEL